MNFVPEHLSTTLYLREIELLENCQTEYHLTGGIENINDDEIDINNTIRGELLSWLCGQKNISQHVHNTGLDIYGILIVGEINLIGASIEFPLRLSHCVITDDFKLEGATIVNLDLSGSHIKGPLTLDFAKTAGSIFLNNGFVADNQVRLYGAEIRGGLNCIEGKFLGNGDVTIDATLVSIRGSAFLEKSIHKNGMVCFHEAEIRGSINCDYGYFENKLGYSISLERAKINGSVFFRGEKYGDKDFIAIGTVRLFQTRIGGALECDNGRFESSDGLASIDASGLNVVGPVLMRQRFKSIGTVILAGASIGGVLDCENGHFETNNDNGNAINADGIVVNDSVFLRDGFSAVGSVRFYGAEIAKEFDCTNANFSYKPVMGRGKDLNKDCFLGCYMKVGGAFKWIKMKSRPNGLVNLQNATVKYLLDDEDSWPNKDMLYIKEFVYENFVYEDMYSAEKRLRWINLQPEFFIGLQPYAQLIKVLRNARYFDEAKRVAIEREIRKGNYLSPSQKIISKAFGLTLDYGYSPQKVLFFFIVPIIIFGALIFGAAKNDGVMIHTRSGVDPYPQFVPLAYSIDVFLPIVDLHQEEYWIPTIDSVKNSWEGVLVMNYMWFHIGFGWLLTTLFVAAITGIIRTDTDS